MNSKAQILKTVCDALLAGDTQAAKVGKKGAGRCRARYPTASKSVSPIVGRRLCAGWGKRWLCAGWSRRRRSPAVR